MSDFSTTNNSGLPQLPAIDLIADRVGSKIEQITESDLYYAQYNWRLVKLYRLTPERRKEICTLLVSLVKKKAPDLVGSDSYKLWVETIKDPASVDLVFSPKTETT